MWLGARSVRELSLPFSPTEGRRVRGLPFYHLQELLDRVPTRWRSNLFRYLSVPQRDLSRESVRIRVKYHKRVHALRALMHVCDISKHDQRVSVQTAAL